MFFFKKKPKIKAVEITDDNFVELVVKAKQPVLLDFWAAWCPPCKVIGPIIDELAKEYQDRAIIGKVNVEKNRLGQHFKVKSIPTLIFFANGQAVERYSGLVPKPNLEEILEEWIAEMEKTKEETTED